ncbi:MAG: ABC transporter permease subunit [Actinobacteria bacterium]|nr:MAG: ABC transporter permease subunit [Actinomycetota bacterium]
MARGLLPGTDRDRRGVQRQRAHAAAERARLHAVGVARLHPQQRLPAAVLEVGEDVAHRLGARRRGRVSPRVLPGAERHEAEVRPAPRPHRAVPDELPPARARVEGDPRRPGRDQHVPLLDGHPVGRAPDRRAPVQPVRGHARARLRLAPVRRPADLRLAGASRLQAFRRVTLPLSLPGVFAAFLFVFIPTLGEFLTPSLVGGTSGYMYGNQIVDLFGTGFPDWETGSVLALFLLAVIAALTVVFGRFIQTEAPA